MSTSWLSSYLSSENEEENVCGGVGCVETSASPQGLSYVCKVTCSLFLSVAMIKCLNKKQLREERPGFSWRSQVTGHHCRKSRQDPEAATHAQSQSKETPMHTHPLLLSSPPPKPREQPPMSIYPSAYLVVGVYCSFAALLG